MLGSVGEVFGASYVIGALRSCVWCRKTPYVKAFCARGGGVRGVDAPWVLFQPGNRQFRETRLSLVAPTGCLLHANVCGGGGRNHVPCLFGACMSPSGRSAGLGGVAVGRYIFVIRNS